MGRHSRKKLDVSPNKDEKPHDLASFTILFYIAPVIAVIIIVIVAYVLVKMHLGPKAFTETMGPTVLILEEWARNTNKLASKLFMKFFIGGGWEHIPRKIPRVKTVSHIWIIAMKPTLVKTLLLFGLSR